MFERDTRAFLLLGVQKLTKDQYVRYVWEKIENKKRKKSINSLSVVSESKMQSERV